MKPKGFGFPFIRFTNWKQEKKQIANQITGLLAVSIHTLHELEASQEKVASRDETIVSIHTLHELEASNPVAQARIKIDSFPFIRFTNWKQVVMRGVSAPSLFEVSIHTLHELEASWYSGTCKPTANRRVSIHTLHELEARLALQN